MNANKGFTLVELLIVISIMGIISAISVPGLLEWRRNAEYKEAAQIALSALRQAKGQAINVNQSVTVRFTLDSSAENEGNQVEIGSGNPLVYGPAIVFKKGIEIKRGTNCDVDSGAVSLSFNPSGSSQSGYICIFDGSTRKYRVGVASATTGRILLQKWQNGVWKQ